MYWTGYELGRAANFVGGYILSLAIACLVLAFSPLLIGGQQNPSPTDMLWLFYFAVALFCFCLPIAWIPLLAGLVASGRFVSSRLARALLGGLLTGVVLDVWVSACVCHLVGTDPDTPPHVMWTMSAFFLPVALSAGAVGGLVYWLVAGRREHRSR